MGQQQCQRWRRTTKEAYRKAVHTAVRIHALLTMCAWRAHIFIEYHVSFFFFGLTLPHCVATHKNFQRIVCHYLDTVIHMSLYIEK